MYPSATAGLTLRDPIEGRQAEDVLRQRSVVASLCCGVRRLWSNNRAHLDWTALCPGRRKCELVAWKGSCRGQRKEMPVLRPKPLCDVSDRLSGRHRGDL